MKKFLVTLSIVMALGFSANAQSDGFFSYSTGEENREGETVFPALPGRGLEGDQDADAPLGSGLLILAGLGVAYAARRKNN
ncbi:MAG: hypothetical protein IJA42_00785 [Bacteroidales bacterium]|nr:hypothetical protein [Bacteroidales bacterium]